MIGESDPSLTRYAGLAVTGELSRRLRLVELIDAELAVERRARPVKVRRRGLSPGQLVVALSECQLVGGEFFADVAQVGDDEAGAGLRAVGSTPSAPTALQRAKDFRRVHCQRIERAAARVGEHLDRALGRDPQEPVTVDLDATEVVVYGARKQGAARSRHGHMSYAPHVAFWAQRGRALTSELVGGNREKLSGPECARIATRALSLLPAGHGPVTFRIDSAYYQLELLKRLRREGARFTVSVPRNQAMWKALAEIPEDAWQDALDMPGAQVAETTYRPDGVEARTAQADRAQGAVQRGGNRQAQGLATAQDDPPRPTGTRARGQARIGVRLQLHPGRYPLAAGRLDRALPPPPRADRGTAEETKLGQALRDLPSGDQNANRVWLTSALLALNLTAFCCDLCPAAGASGKAPTDAPLRRAAKTLRNLLFTIPARIVRTGRRLILRPPAGFRHSHILQATLDAIYTLGP